MLKSTITGYDASKSIKDTLIDLANSLPNKFYSYDLIKKTLKSTGIFEKAKENGGIKNIYYFIANEVTNYIISEFRYNL
jgi:hypothetical protein